MMIDWLAMIMMMTMMVADAVVVWAGVGGSNAALAESYPVS